jgi:multiple sugar transport system permease protein
VPETVQWSNFTAVWDAGPVLRWLFNSVTVGLMAATAVTISSALVAFGFAYFRFRHRNLLFGLVLATMMLPGAVTMIPVYLIWNQVGLVDTQVPLWAQNLFGSAFYIFLLRQFFLGIPRELFEAARVDGASTLRIFFSIVLPALRPAAAILGLFTFMQYWNDFLWPYVALDPEHPTVQVALSRLSSGYYQDQALVMAGTLMATLPLLVVVVIFGRQLISGIMDGAVKA